MRILALNLGSSTLRYRLWDSTPSRVLAEGRLEGIGKGREKDALSGHREALDQMAGRLAGLSVDAVGHRVVHGGERFREPTRITDQVLEEIRAVSDLAPIHNPLNLLGIEKALAVWKEIPQVAVFDTAFHHTLPAHAYRYAVPEDLYRRHGVRRYGFHGISHAFVARRAAQILNRPIETLHLITLHLGNGASAAAIRAGRSVDTSMGLTPLEGLVMGTRSGDVDPGVFAYLSRVLGKPAEAIEGILSRESGLLGLAGSNDMRDLVRRSEAGDERAALALEIFCYRIKKYVGAYAAALGKVDAVVFTGGIGENSAVIRSRSLQDLSLLGIVVDETLNRADSDQERSIDSGAGVRILVIPTDEEREIALQTASCLQAEGPGSSSSKETP